MFFIILFKQVLAIIIYRSSIASIAGSSLKYRQRNIRKYQGQMKHLQQPLLLSILQQTNCIRKMQCTSNLNQYFTFHYIYEPPSMNKACKRIQAACFSRQSWDKNYKFLNFFKNVSKIARTI